MRILVLTLMMGFLSHSAFGAAEGRSSFWQGIKSKAWSLHQFLVTPIVAYIDANPGVFAASADEAEGEEAAKTIHFYNFTDVLFPEVGAYLSKEEVAAISKSNPLLKGARETMAQKGFILNMGNIDEEKTGQLAQLLFDTRNVTKLTIRNLRGKWEIFRSALEMKPEIEFNNLEKLDLSEDMIDEKMIQEINDILFSRIRSLTSLDLENNLIREAGAIAIANSPHMKNLTSLNLRSNRICPAGARAIANSPHMARLTSLNLGWNQIGDEGATAIARMAKLISLRLGENQIGHAGATAIARIASLTNLDLEDNQIEDAGATAIANSPHMAHLTSLDLCNNQIGDVGASAIAESEYMDNLTSLNLDYNQLGDEGAQAIANSQYMARLTILVLSLNRIGLAGATAIAESEYMARLTSLDLYNNQIRDDVKVVIRNRLRQTHPKCVVVL